MSGKGFTHIRVGYAGAHLAHGKRAADPSCATGGFIKNPTAGLSVDSSKPLNISWDTTCLTTTAVDIYLYAPGSAQSRIHMWQDVNFGVGSYQATLQPNWWNATASATLQLSIVTSGSQPFLSTLPAGPVFTATYSSGSSTGSNDATTGSGITTVNNFNTKHGPTKGGIAAAVIFPLLIVGLLIAAYFKISRARGREKRKRWSEAVDKRMSTISTDWKSMSAAGASAAIRNSMAISSNGGNRASAFSFGAIRPSSTVAVEGGQAGIGAAHGLYTHENSSLEESAPQMSQLRPGVRASAFGERVSRVSFAADVRPSGESRRTVTSRAFHTSFIPPLPERQDSGELSPTQTEGPLTLTPEAIRERISGQENTARPSMDDVMPALNMMRTGGEDANTTDDGYLLSPPKPNMPLPPTPVHPAPPSPIVGMMPMQPASVMSPDEMLRMYATRKGTPGPGSPSPISFPVPAVSYNGNGMRTLYSPTTPNSAAPMMPTAHTEASMAATEMSRYSIGEADTSDAYIGTAD